MTTTDPSPDPRPPETGTTQPALRQHVVRSTRTSRTWTAVILFALVLILLLIFILQNGQRVKVSFLGFDGHLPLAVAMLLAAIAGAADCDPRDGPHGPAPPGGPPPPHRRGSPAAPLTSRSDNVCPRPCPCGAVRPAAGRPESCPRRVRAACHRASHG